MFPLLWRCRSSLPHYAQPWVQRLAHSIDPGTQRRVDQAALALGGADLGVIEEAANHYLRGVARDQQQREGVAKLNPRSSA